MNFTGRSRTRLSATLSAAAVAALALALSACGGNVPASQTTAAPGTTSPETSSAAAETTSAPASTPAGTPASTSAADALCSAAMLSGALDDSGGGAAGSIYIKLIVKNTTGTTCVLDGYPGVSLVGEGNGTQLGAAAERDAAAPSSGPIQLAAGASATAVLRYTQAGNYQNCQQVPAEGLRIYPPSATDALYIAHPLTACSNEDIKLLTIGAFQAGTFQP
ncbi:DUF4232 domain-containing protein [Pseudarthrobacter sp. P1]|uniref:DUF4232 domain-containing protein n=1 Tax=Pseudarthrobacter sp. P1 TaxID=3418418 RepID=UPI003CF4464E